MSKAEAIRILAEVIDLLRKQGVEVNNPYDIENFFADYATHSNLFATGKFEEPE